MFSHVMVGANDIDASRKFYDAVLGAIGYAAGVTDEKGRIFYLSPTGVFAVTKPINGASATAANGGTIGFAVKDPASVDAWHAAGVANGGTSIEDSSGRPRRRLRQDVPRLCAGSVWQQALRAAPDGLRSLHGVPRRASG